MKLQNKFTVTFHRQGCKPEVMIFCNMVTQLQKALMLDTVFNGAEANSWYIGGILSEANTNTTAQDTLADKDWTEADNYAARVAWEPDAAEVLVDTDISTTKNATPVIIDITEAGTWAGFFVASDEEQGETASLLFATAFFPQEKKLNAGDQVSVVYEVTLA